MAKPVMMIVPVLNGYVVMPFNMDLLVSLKDGQREDGIHVCKDPDEIGKILGALYEPAEGGE